MPDDETYKPKPIALSRGVSVYQPATPFRAIEVGRNNDGTFWQTELVVVGIQATTSDHWHYGGKLKLGQSPQEPRTSNGEDLAAAGYVFDSYLGNVVTHDVLIWTEEMGIEPVEEVRSDNTRVITAPASMPEEWWFERVAEAKKNLSR